MEFRLTFDCFCKSRIPLVTSPHFPGSREREATVLCSVHQRLAAGVGVGAMGASLGCALPCERHRYPRTEQAQRWQPSHRSHGSVIGSCKHSHATPLAYKIFIRLIQELFQTGSDSSSLRTTLNSILIGYASERRGLRPAVAYILYQPHFPVELTMC